MRDASGRKLRKGDAVYNSRDGQVIKLYYSHSPTVIVSGEPSRLEGYFTYHPNDKETYVWMMYYRVFPTRDEAIMDELRKHHLAIDQLVKRLSHEEAIQDPHPKR